MRISWLGVLISAIILVVLRHLWNAHFGGADWGRLAGAAISDAMTDKKVMGMEFINALVLCAALGWVIGRLRDRVTISGIGVGILACVGFAWTTASTGYIHGAPLKSVLPDAEYLLAAYVIAGAILGATAPKKAIIS